MNNYPMYTKYQSGDRQFLFPFLLGGLAGGAAVSVSRPRPIYNVAPQPYPPYPPFPPPARPYYYNSYGGYIPYY